MKRVTGAAPENAGELGVRAASGDSTHAQDLRSFERLAVQQEAPGACTAYQLGPLKAMDQYTAGAGVVDLLRPYGPQQSYFVETWKPDDIVRLRTQERGS